MVEKRILNMVLRVCLEMQGSVVKPTYVNPTNNVFLSVIFG
jgi:hypothetical protein